jgi:hypothetical protein
LTRLQNYSMHRLVFGTRIGYKCWCQRKRNMRIGLLQGFSKEFIDIGAVFALFRSVALGLGGS